MAFGRFGFVIFLVLLSTVSSAVEFNESQFRLNQAECEQMIGSSRKGPERFGALKYQNGESLCWALAGSKLLEEQLCKESETNPESKYKCGQNLSVFDTSRCNWKIGSGEDSATPWQGAKYALDCAMNPKEPGVCADSDAPYFSTQEEQGIVARIVSTKTQICGLTSITATGGQVGELMNWLQEVSRRFHLVDSEVMRALQSPEIRRDFEKNWDARKIPALLKRHLISEKCRNNRFRVSSSVVPDVLALESPLREGKEISISPSITKIKNKISEIRRVFESDRSVSLGVCMAQLFQAQSVRSEFQGRCGEHDVIASNWRWNAAANRCEILIHDSSGNDSLYPQFRRAPLLEGWQSLELILGQTYSMTSLRGRTKK